MDTDFPLTLSGDVMMRILIVIKFLAGGPMQPERLSTKRNIKITEFKQPLPTKLMSQIRNLLLSVSCYQCGDRGQCVLSVCFLAGNVLIKLCM